MARTRRATAEMAKGPGVLRENGEDPARVVRVLPEAGSVVPGSDPGTVEARGVPEPPTLVDEVTAKMPCAPGAWGSSDSCATHEGQPLDESGKCFWGRAASAPEKALAALVEADKVRARNEREDAHLVETGERGAVERASQLVDPNCPTGECVGECDSEAHGLFGEDTAPDSCPAPSVTHNPFPDPKPNAGLRMDVLVELSRMARADAGGSCVLYRKSPEVSAAVAAEVRRLCLSEPGATVATGLPSYCFNREAVAVLADLVRNLGR